MITGQNATPFFGNVERALSPSRFTGYKQQGGTDTEALAKYVWNTLLCEALYPGFQILEVAFRNATHLEIVAHSKDGSWLLKEVGFLYDVELQAIRDAKQSIQNRGIQLSEDTLTAELSFGFWTSFFDFPYDQMWHKIIGGVFPNMPRPMRTRKAVSAIMNKVRKLRNAALHHHSIWHWQDLHIQHQQMRTLIGYICKASSAMADQIDRFPAIHAKGPQACMATAQAMLNAIQSKQLVIPANSPKP